MSNVEIHTSGGGSMGIDLATNRVQVYNVFVDIVRVAYVNNSLGTMEDLTTVVSNLPCAIKWKSGRERIQFDKVTHYLDATLNCRVPAGVTIATTDRVLFSDDYYEIVDVRNRNNLGRLLAIDIRKIE